jgi:flagellar basal body-associated protein FliL
MGLAQPDTDEDKEKDREIAAGAMAILLAAFIIILLAPLVAYMFF